MARDGLFKLTRGAMVIVGGFGIFSAYNIHSGNEKFYRDFVMPPLRMFDAETTHSVAIKASKYGLVPRMKSEDHASLKTTVLGLQFDNPVGLAAGFDKQGEAVKGLYKMGFGFVEVGSITPNPQDGNPKPRVFRLKEDQAIINRYGFNSDGHEVVYDRLKSLREDEGQSENPAEPDDRNFLNENFWTGSDREKLTSYQKSRCRGGILGVNLGKNKTTLDSAEDYVKGVKKFGELSDYLVINISSPNTPGLRALQGRKQLQELISKVVKARNELSCAKKPPLLIKIAPDLTEQDQIDIAAVVSQKQCGVSGLIISNTTVSRPESLKSKHKTETGGLSGQPLKEISTEVIKNMYSLTKGELPIIGVGGICCGADAYDKIRAGASLVQLYSALAYDGPPVINKIKRELREILQKEGFVSVADAVGADHKK
ncbi:dihydroorotate dehydrogenase (quinone), mitochondrial-like isoform X2 [Tubulanus polymorphus]|uniref:dihydroorotate dehydrogenase (quinone), mitochondrial-like isoform X2 n=1 Tax=Tubulanus polymorphus TaxID=672921 RepID=UPI003DA4B376